MKKTLAALTVFSLLLAALLVTGCDEVKPAAEGPSISPPSATINKGQSIVFTASDGFEYRWKLSNTSLGILSSINGPSTTYTSLQNPGTDSSVQVLTLTSRIIGAPEGNTSSTNSTGATYVRSAEAYINHIALQISPSTVSSLKYGQSVTLRASNGTGTYNWRMASPGLGSLSSYTGQETTYTSWYDPGTNSTTATQTLIVRSFESEASVTVTQTK